MNEIRELLAEMWSTLDSTVYRVIDPEDGSNVDNAQTRRADASVWLYVDDSNGFRLLPDSEVRGLTLEEIEEE